MKRNVMITNINPEIDSIDLCHQFVMEFGDAMLQGDDVIMSDASLRQKYVEAYKKVSEEEVVSFDDLLRFTVFCIEIQPEILYVKKGMVSAEFLIEQINKLLAVTSIDLYSGLVDSLKCHDFSGATLLEFAEANAEGLMPPISFSDCNFDKIDRFFHTL